MNSDYRKSSNDALLFLLSQAESQIAHYISEKKDILDEIKRRKPIYQQRFYDGKLVMQTNEYIEGVVDDELMAEAD